MTAKFSKIPMPEQPKAPRKRTATSLASMADREKRFVERYLVNGNNATEAAEFAGYGVAGAAVRGCELLKRPNVAAIMEARARTVAEVAQLNTDVWASQVSALATSSIGDLYDAGGKLIPLHLLPAHVKAAISSVETLSDGSTKVRFWDKNTALITMGKHLGLFERDNRQQAPNIRVEVVLVG